MSPPSLQEAARPAAARTGLLDRWFRSVSVPADVPREISDLARRGSIVFVMRSAGVLNFLFLRWLLRQHGPPRLRAALGLSGLVPRLFRVRASAPALQRALGAGDAAVVFLQRASGPDPFPLLVELQRRLDRPVFLVPALLVWTRRPQKLKPSLGEILFGTPDAPSRLANGIGFLLNRRRAVLGLGRPSDLSTIVRERTGRDDAVLGRLVRGALNYHLAGQVRAIVGPPLKTPSRLREQVLRDRGLRRALEREARTTHRTEASLRAEAERNLREIASRYSPAFVEVLRPVLSWLFRKLFDGIDVDAEGLARVKRAAGETPIVLCPSHKSYVDFLVLSWLFYQNGLTLPHVAAGINLAFWPFGAIARRGGGFFIRRSLKGDRVYTATLRAYVKQLQRDRYPQEFYLEGGRSRTGKLLFPKTGLFSMEVDAWLEGAAPDVLFVPVAIDYERLLEGTSYARELSGAAKRKEDFSGLVRATKVLGRRYGRLSIQFEEPVSLRDFAAGRLGARARELDPDEVMPSPDLPAGATPAAALAGGEGAGKARKAGRAGKAARAAAAAGAELALETPTALEKRELVQALANRVAYGINRAVTMTTVGLVAAATLSHRRRGLAAGELADRIELLRKLAAEEGARFSRRLATAPTTPLEPGPVSEAMASLAEEGLVRVERAAGQTIYGAVDERRAQLDYHKNAVLHRFVPLALAAIALRSLGGEAERAAVEARALWFSRLFKLEFMYLVDAPFPQLFEAQLARLRRHGLASEAEGRVGPGADRQGLDFLADLLRPYLEAYRVAAQALLALSPGTGLERRALVRAALEHGRASYAAGHIALPEAVSQATLENALEWFSQSGALVATATSGRTLALAWREAELPALLSVIDAALAAQ